MPFLLLKKTYMSSCYSFAIVRHLTILMFIFLGLISNISCLLSKNKLYKINVLAPVEYISIYQQTHQSLGTDLLSIALSFENRFNNSTMARNNG